VALPVDIRRTMSRPTFEPAQGPLPEPAPEPAGRGPKRCEGCGTITGLLIFVPNRLGGGRRVCLGCLRALDALREAPRRRAMAETDQEQLQAATVMLARVFHARLTRGTSGRLEAVLSGARCLEHLPSLAGPTVAAQAFGPCPLAGPRP